MHHHFDALCGDRELQPIEIHTQNKKGYCDHVVKISTKNGDLMASRSFTYVISSKPIPWVFLGNGRRHRFAIVSTNKRQADLKLLSAGAPITLLLSHFSEKG